MFQPHIELNQLRLEVLPHLVVQAALEPLEPLAVGDHHVVFHAHVGSGAEQRVLEDPADIGGALVLRLAGHVALIGKDGPLGRRERAGDQVEERALAGAVAADDRDEVPFLDLQVDVGKGLVLVYRALIEDYRDVLELYHLSTLALRAAFFSFPDWVMTSSTMIRMPLIRFRSLGVILTT